MTRERMDLRQPAGEGSGADECAERLSCLLDGELDGEDCRALVERLRHDEAALRRWRLFGCVGDALRSPEVAAWHSEDFVARVSAQLEKEPTVLAPAAPASRASARRWLLPGAGAAVAAAVLVAVGLPSRQAAQSDVVASRDVVPPTVLVSAGGGLKVDRSPVLERYLAAHRELSEPAVMPNSTPYVRTSGAMPMQEGR